MYVTTIIMCNSEENVIKAIMITLEMPLWFLIIVVVCQCLLLIYLIVSDFFVKLIHRKYDLELKDKEKSKENKYHKFYIGENKLIDLTQMFGEGNEPTAKDFEKMILSNYEYEKENNNE